jgi:hypothetical protein
MKRPLHCWHTEYTNRPDLSTQPIEKGCGRLATVVTTWQIHNPDRGNWYWVSRASCNVHGGGKSGQEWLEWAVNHPDRVRNITEVRI